MKYLVLIFLSCYLLSCEKDNETVEEPTSQPPTNLNLNPNLTYGSVADAEGNEYATIVIDTQEWMAENLNTTKYANGDPIPNVIVGAQWTSLTTGAWVHYNHDSQYKNPYGKLYNWYTVADPRNVCPTGWRVPSENEWSNLINYLDTNSVFNPSQNTGGGKMKSVGTQYWQSPNEDATNESGLTCLPGGYFSGGGTFGNIGVQGNMWSSSEGLGQFSTVNAFFITLDKGNGSATMVTTSKQAGFSVRCIRD